MPKGFLIDLDANYCETLFKIGYYLTSRSNFTKEQPLIIVACEEEGKAKSLEQILLSGIVCGGGHAVKLNSIKYNVFLFSLSFFGADYGMFIAKDEDKYNITSVNNQGEIIEDIKEAPEKLKKFPLRTGKISGYEGILQKFLTNK